MYKMMDEVLTSVDDVNLTVFLYKKQVCGFYDGICKYKGYSFNEYKKRLSNSKYKFNNTDLFVYFIKNRYLYLYLVKNIQNLILMI